MSAEQQAERAEPTSERFVPAVRLLVCKSYVEARNLAKICLAKVVTGDDGRPGFQKTRDEGHS